MDYEDHYGSRLAGMPDWAGGGLGVGWLNRQAGCVIEGCRTGFRRRRKGFGPDQHSCSRFGDEVC